MERRAPGRAGQRVGGPGGRALQSEGLENPWSTTETMTGPHLSARPPPSSPGLLGPLK